MASLGRSVRFVGRVFARSPGVAAFTVVSLALGIGANTAMFSILDALVLRPLPVRQPERLVRIGGIYRNGGSVPFSFPIFREIRARQRVFSAVFGWSSGGLFNFEANGARTLANVRAVTGNYYSELGAAPLLGRLIAPADTAAMSRVAVLGYGFWERRFARDPAAVGSVIHIEGRPFTVIGVTRKWFTGITVGEQPEVTIPLTTQPVIAGNGPDFMENRALLWIFTAGRLNRGATIPQARSQLDSFWPELLMATAPTASSGARLRSFLSMRLNLQSAATGVSTSLRSQFTRPLYVLLAMVALILLIACLNLSSLTLARTAARSHELTTRIVLGAGRWRIIRQLLSESVILSIAGSLLGLALAEWGSRFLVALITWGHDAPIVLDLRPDWRVLSFTAGLAVLTAVFVGLAPALRMSRHEPAAVLRASPRTLGRTTGNMGKILIASQIALSLVLLSGAWLLLRTFQSLRAFHPGFEKSGVLEISLYPRPEGYSNLDINRYRRELVERIRHLPGVTSAGFSDLPVPAGEEGWKDTASPVTGESDTGLGQLATLAAVTPGFLQTLGVPLVRGRDFNWTDDPKHPRVAIIDSTVARKLFPSGGAIGRRIRFGVQPEFQDLQVIGVAGNARLVDLRDGSAAVLYVPYTQHPQYGEEGNLFLRSFGGGTARAATAAIDSFGHEYAIGAQTLDQTVDRALGRERAAATMSGFFGAVALLLAGVGLFGLMSYSVTRRTREIGIRLALGSPQGAVLRIVVRETIWLTLAGIVAGAPCALAAARLIGRMLFVISPHDPVALAAASGALFAVAAVAGYLPARRATRLDPMAALRCE